ncbi:MAG: VOC family protein [Gemmatimonadetes bacterium]|nr:VOC family protein [Gemmatimonadota bacterium]NNL30715.1 VOC family protein [Gemmatimonadota bacterium]
MSDTPLGRFCWYDLMTPDPDRAPDFYGPVIGWTTTPFEGAAEPYTMWVNGETPIGGVVELPDEAVQGGAPPHWLAYVSTPDAKATAAKATSLGGTVMMEMELDNVGSFAVIADPHGAVIALYEPVEWTPWNEGVPPVGQFSWHELYTNDHAEALAFYSELFGWEATEQMDMGEAGIYQMYGLDGQTLGGMMNRTPDMPPPAWMYYVRVSDIEAAATAVTEQGGEVWNGPMEVPGGDMVAHCRDAQGAAFALHSTAS